MPPVKLFIWSRYSLTVLALFFIIPKELSSTGNYKGRPMSHIVAIINQKGGTGKTTTAVNLGASLAYQGFRTLIVDLDPQGHTTVGIGIDPDAVTASMAEVLTVPKKSINEVAVPTYILGLDVAPAHIHLARAAEQVYPLTAGRPGGTSAPGSVRPGGRIARAFGRAVRCRVGRFRGHPTGDIGPGLPRRGESHRFRPGRRLGR